MTQFKNGLIMKVTKGMDTLCESLRSLGYKGGFPHKESAYLVNNDTGHKGNYCLYEEGAFNTAISRIIVPDDSIELYLALAAMTKGDTPIVGEYMYCIESNAGNSSWSEPSIEGNLYKVEEFSDWASTVKGSFGSSYSRNHWRKPTVEEIINHFSKQKMKIIGYKLIKPEYEEAVYKIGNTGIVSVARTENFFKNATLSVEASLSIKNLRDAGVLDLWFEPVYEEQFKVGDYITPISRNASYLKPGEVAKVIEVREDKLIFSHEKDSHDYCHPELLRKATPEEVTKAQEKTFKVGDFEIVVKDGRAFHKSDNITTFVKELINQFKPQTVGGYMFEVDEVTFAKTGCQYKSTLKEWREIHKNLK